MTSYQTFIKLCYVYNGARYFVSRVRLFWGLCLILPVFTVASNQLDMNTAQNQPVFDTVMPDRAKQRSAFLRAEKQIWKMDNNDLADAVESLGDYPLIPYLIERKLSHNMRLSDEPQIRAFLTKYKNTPLASKVRRSWLKYLAKKNKADLFIDYFQSSSDPKLACKFIEFQIEKGIAVERLFSEISELWNVGKSQPKQCDGIFKKWIDANQLSEDLILLRIGKAANGGQHTLIPYLKTLLPENKQYLADLWHKARRDPASVRKLKTFKGKYPLVEAEIMTYALSRLIWRDQALALRLMPQAEQKIIFTQSQRAKIYSRFGIKLAIDGHKDAEQWLTKANEVGDDSQMTRWHLAYLLRKQEWEKVSKLIEQLAPQKVSENVYTYWLARAYEVLDRTQDAQVLYAQLAKSRHYYGFLASARLDQPYHLQHAAVEMSQQAIDKVLAMPSTARAYELRQLNRLHQARLEWRQTQLALGEDQKLASTVVSSEWGWHDQAIFTFSREGYLSDIPRRFPTAYQDIITREANKNRIDPQWAFAIARRESSFMPDAVSSANARGLMQVLPSTAKYLEKKRVSSKQLLDVETNAKIGNKYLRYLMNKLDNNTVLATASYNAGWRRVKQWLPESEAMEADIWVELIPFKETRNYVKAVMAYRQIYEAQLQDDMQLHNEVAYAKAKVFREFIETEIPVSL